MYNEEIPMKKYMSSNENTPKKLTELEMLGPYSNQPSSNRRNSEKKL